MSTPATALSLLASRLWGDWLEAMEWDLRMTLTFSPRKFRKVSHEMALRRVRDSMNWLGGHIRRAIPWLAFTEFTTVGHAHVHALVTFIDDRRPRPDQMWSWEQWMRRRNGIVRIEDYVPGIGGASYGSKYAGSAATEWDCSKAFVKMVQRDLRETQLRARGHAQIPGDTVNAARGPEKDLDRALVIVGAHTTKGQKQARCQIP